MTCAIFSNHPRIDCKFLLDTVVFWRVSLICEVQAMALCFGSLTDNVLVLSNHPKQIFSSLAAPSASILSSATISFRLTVVWLAQDISAIACIIVMGALVILLKFFRLSTDTVIMSSTYTSVFLYSVIVNFTLSLAAWKGMSSSRYFSLGILLAKSE